MLALHEAARQGLSRLALRCHLPARYLGQLHAVAFCSLGRHETSGNWCPWCGTLVRPDAYAAWCVELADGTFHTVTAINEHHARSIVVHGGDARVLARQGVKELASHVVVHPDNIVSCRQWADAEAYHAEA